MISDQYISAEDLSMQTRNKAINAFIMKITDDAKAHGIVITVTKSKNLYSGEGVCCGLFVPPKRGIGRIRVAAGGRSLAESVLSLAHEYIHMRQYFNKEKIYYNPSYLKLEKNTEKRALNFMKRNRLPPKFLKAAKRSSEKYLQELQLEYP